MLGKPTRSAQFSPFSFRLICEFVLFLPFNLIPVVGTPIFLLLTGRRAGPFYHWRYFALRGLGRKDKKEFVKSRRLQYTWFGTVALVLQLLPVLSMLFLLTTAAGAALWAADLEKARSLQVESQAPSVPGYVDDPV
ncbi:MAG: hypothetical protein M1825_001460 [Sarcosagium campestre]|nr:MAG: hypothetical protein M1825_001460 [Sarcosagium campestre]